jgi:hypothetical protein
MSIKQIRITVGNESGTLMELTKVLADYDIELRAMNLVDIKDVRSLRIIVDDVYTANMVLKAAGYDTVIRPVIVLELEDTPESLPAFLAPLAAEGITLKYGYSFLENRQKRFYFAMRIEDYERAEKVLIDAGFKPIMQDDLHRIFF